MSFEKMKRDELYKLATENFAVELEETSTKPQILAKLVEEGVTWDMAVAYDASARAVDEKEKESAANVVTTTSVAAEKTYKEEVVPDTAETVVSTTVIPDKVLLVMNRENPTYEVRGYKFTRTHPFGIVNAADAEYIVSNVEGFRYATPREASEFYG